MAIKSEELKSGCIAKAADDEPVFVLRAQDKTAPYVVKMWGVINDSMLDDQESYQELLLIIDDMLENVLPHAGCDKAQEAYRLAKLMEAWPNRRWPN